MSKNEWREQAALACGRNNAFAPLKNRLPRASSENCHSQPTWRSNPARGDLPKHAVAYSGLFPQGIAGNSTRGEQLPEGKILCIEGASIDFITLRQDRGLTCFAPEGEGETLKP